MDGLPLPILRVPPQPGAQQAKIAALRQRLGGAFDAVDFPARHWQIVIAAETQGADHAVRVALRELRAESYADATSVLVALAASPPIFETLMAT